MSYTILGLVALGGVAMLAAFAPRLFADAAAFVDADDISMTSA